MIDSVILSAAAIELTQLSLLNHVVGVMLAECGILTAGVDVARCGMLADTMQEWGVREDQKSVKHDHGWTPHVQQMISWTHAFQSI
jgi:hypothetical protein